ncbi:MAG: zinc ribbon domain-containing protein [Burkholderiales bacterium]|nr:zinc ribbon domain-containing protein [Burkholderiales bacterium]MDR4517230.1 zinc-ribbon domain-containing protein [Nitrosomonas sp.]
MLCPKCGTENTEQADFCTHCAEPLKIKDVQTSQLMGDAADARQDGIATQQGGESGDETANTAASSSHNNESGASMREAAATQHRPRITNIDFQSDKAKEKPVVSIGMYIVVILLSIPVPPIGIAMGYTYLRKAHPDAKNAGKIWLIWGAITLVTLVLLAII